METFPVENVSQTKGIVNWRGVAQWRNSFGRCTSKENVLQYGMLVKKVYTFFGQKIYSFRKGNIHWNVHPKVITNKDTGPSKCLLYIQSAFLENLNKFECLPIRGVSNSIVHITSTGISFPSTEKVMGKHPSLLANKPLHDIIIFHQENYVQMMLDTKHTPQVRLCLYRCLL